MEPNVRYREAQISVNVRQIGNCSVVEVEESFDPAFARWLGSSLTRLCEGEPGSCVVIDLSGVPVVGSRAVRALRRALDVPDVRVALVNRRLSARRVMRRAFGSPLFLFTSVHEAVESLSARPAGASPASRQAFRHEALLYAGPDGFVEGVTPFIADAVAADEPVLVAVSAERGASLREHLGTDADAVTILDMAEVGRNPARIIPAWREFAARHLDEGRNVRGIGEPIWGGRRAADVVECQRHENLVNLAFADHGAAWLLCPYDTETLADEVIEEALRSHPHVLREGVHSPSTAYVGDERALRPFDVPLPEPPDDAWTATFDARTLHVASAFAARFAAGTDLSAAEIRDLALAVAEIAANSVTHGGGGGRLRIWRDADSVVAEVTDSGHIDRPLIGRERPLDERDARRGLWLANQLCDLVQIQSSPAGTAVRLHIRRR
jgi:anti-sigma regulatory factor (Ser/Thr protein kinase)/anti-anti-sigma regulatory factor